MTVVLFSSIMFSVFMGMSVTDNINGKLRAVKFGSEKKLISLKNNSRLIDYDIKDEYGNVLGGKKASIQFAYDMMQKAEAKSKPVSKIEEKPTVNDVKSVVTEEVAPMIAKTDVEPPVKVKREALKRGMQPSSIYELSERIKELTSMLQDDVEDDEDEFVNIEKEIKALRLRKRSLIKKLQKTEKARPLNDRAKQALSQLEYLDPSEIPALVEDAKIRSKPTKKQKPLVSEAKKRTEQKKPMEDDDVEDDIDDDDSGVEEEDYPDDPTFRGKQEV